jgi:hypothetical protein
VKKGKAFGTYDIKYFDDGDVAKEVPVKVEFERRVAVDTYVAMGTTCVILKPAVADPVLSIAKGSRRVGSSGLCVSERVAQSASESMEQSEALQKAMKSSNLSQKDFSSLVAAKFAGALADPGEAVGAIAAQSVGEPSTQMTLNVSVQMLDGMF